jgi:hypothetical protein
MLSFLNECLATWHTYWHLVNLRKIDLPNRHHLSYFTRSFDVSRSLTLWNQQLLFVAHWMQQKHSSRTVCWETSKGKCTDKFACSLSFWNVLILLNLVMFCFSSPPVNICLFSCVEQHTAKILAKFTHAVLNCATIVQKLLINLSAQLWLKDC